MSSIIMKILQEHVKNIQTQFSLECMCNPEDLKARKKRENSKKVIKLLCNLLKKLNTAIKIEKINTKSRFLTAKGSSREKTVWRNIKLVINSSSEVSTC